MLASVFRSKGGTLRFLGFRNVAEIGLIVAWVIASILFLNSAFDWELRSAAGETASQAEVE